MSLPTLPQKGPRAPATFRLTKATLDCLRALSKAHGLSQANILEFLINKEYQEYVEKLAETKDRPSVKK